jgi:hypothetical protein
MLKHFGTVGFLTALKKYPKYQPSSSDRNDGSSFLYFYGEDGVMSIIFFTCLPKEVNFCRRSRIEDYQLEDLFVDEPLMLDEVYKYECSKYPEINGPTGIGHCIFKQFGEKVVVKNREGEKPFETTCRYRG